VEPIEWIQAASEKAGIALPAGAMDRFVRYRDLLLEWNQKINLISRSDEERIVRRHFLGSIGLLTVLRLDEGARVLDLGTGAGFPGLPLKIMRPDLQLILVESVKKKTLFLEAAVAGMELRGVTIKPDRVESLAGKMAPVPWVLSRAVSDMSTLLQWSRPVLAKGGTLAVIKGKNAEKETAELIRRFHIPAADCRRFGYNPFPEFENLEDTSVVVVRRPARK
jgi:16S rRNA (guanine527-N7)-methyltransferase